MVNAVCFRFFIGCASGLCAGIRASSLWADISASCLHTGMKRLLCAGIHTNCEKLSVQVIELGGVFFECRNGIFAVKCEVFLQLRMLCTVFEP